MSTRVLKRRERLHLRVGVKDPQAGSPATRQEGEKLGRDSRDRKTLVGTLLPAHASF